ncbi:NUDIX hydrolase domain-like protein [Podospora appendiculata]|uniref:NUDIX hydrolase domain-like protein n=1 Tax=Podospora appendiculata TaxID=314037 RepID=A0AAE0XKW2_9PEZI|nr:NUDIX hydrolase domain-like protein [Podospora appendiculata]
MSISADAAEAVVVSHPPHHHTPTEYEVQIIIQSIRDASDSDENIATLPGQDEGFDDSSSSSSSSNYWDASTMAPLNPASAAAIARLRAYKPPPFPLWDRLPVSRRAAVLMLLFADRRGDLRVVITMRAASLRSFSGHAALPGGKADSGEETPYQIARREAWEEIGLPMDDAKIPAPFRIEHLCYLPMNLARTELVVRPCVAFLHTTATTASATAGAEAAKPTTTVTVEDGLIPRLDAREVAAVFSAPFHNFLRATDEPGLQTKSLPPGRWYEGSWTAWNDEPWRVHYFYVPINDQRVTKPRVRDGGLAAIAEGIEDEAEEAGRYKVWGMTARIVVDAARAAYATEPEFEHNSHFGDERMIEELEKLGRLTPKMKTPALAPAPAPAPAPAAGNEANGEDDKKPAKM